MFVSKRLRIFKNHVISVTDLSIFQFALTLASLVCITFRQDSTGHLQTMLVSNLPRDVTSQLIICSYSFIGYWKHFLYQNYCSLKEDCTIVFIQSTSYHCLQCSLIVLSKDGFLCRTMNNLLRLSTNGPIFEHFPNCGRVAWTDHESQIGAVVIKRCKSGECGGRNKTFHCTVFKPYCVFQQIATFFLLILC